MWRPIGKWQVLVFNYLIVRNIYDSWAEPAVDDIETLLLALWMFHETSDPNRRQTDDVCLGPVRTPLGDAALAGNPFETGGFWWPKSA